ncbi:GNAT family N-acetyltransferase [Sphingomonas sp.]|uniref:GNAT family N-acetyltransferase n=1 Tax=Sphingomonas sp. TaxID=28214 RepID=UPI00286B7DA2|nr:GNAT family N-acetyltransferase [Sphingomonas sp.]
MTMILTDAALADAHEIADLFGVSFTETFGHLYAPSDLALFLAGKTAADFAHELADPSFHFQFARDSTGAAVGFVKLGPPDFPIASPPDTIELRQIYVLERTTGQGIGASLMDWATDRARGVGARHLQLSVYIDNHRARRFYEKRGYVRIASYRFMVGNHADEDIIMRVAL